MVVVVVVVMEFFLSCFEGAGSVSLEYELVLGVNSPMPTDFK